MEAAPSSRASTEARLLPGPAKRALLSQPHLLARAGGLALRFAVPISACGVLVVALAYAAGRSGRSWAVPAFWCGDLLIFLPLAARALAPYARARSVAIVAQAAFQSLVAWMYSPVMFKFPDELQHWRTAEDILHHQTLFHPSTALPVSPRFPGLEEITTALASLTHLGLFPAGLIVVSLAHVSVSVAVFIVMKSVTRNERLAAAAALIFAISPHNAFFNGMFLYEAPALLFLAVALLAAARHDFSARRDIPPAVACLAAVSVTHHVTAAMAALDLLALGALTTLQRGFRWHGARLLGLGALGAGLLAAWVTTVAPMTYSYLSGPVSSVVLGFLRGTSVEDKDPVGAGVAPVVTALTMVGTATMAILIVSGVVLAWRRPRASRRPRGSILRALTLLSLSFFAVLGIRLLATDGAELAGRLLTYVYLLAAVGAALAVTHLWEHGGRWGGALALAAVVAVFVGNTTSGWPAPYERVPGRFHVDGFESGVDPANVEAARWIAANTPANATVACDFSSCSLVGGYGTQRALNNVPELFYAPTIDRSIRALVSERSISYVLVDRRLTSQRPVTEGYFHNETAAQSRMVPFPRPSLTKFDRAPSISRVYDNGPIAIYDLRRLNGA